jgi:signal transduction histidine kinase
MGGSCGPLSEDLSVVFQTIESSGARLLHLVNSLLDSSSLRQGTFSLSMETVCLQSVVIESMQVRRTRVLVEQAPPLPS